MTKVKYSITIHTGRTNSLIFSKDDLQYKGKPVAASYDHIRFYKQKIVLRCERNRKSLSLDDICEYKQSSIYTQIYKSLLYLYMGNGKRVSIRSIELKTSKKEDNRIIDKTNQPLMRDFHFSKKIPQNVLLHLFDESPEGECLRVISTHFLKALTSTDRYFKFERLWRAFEQTAYWHLYNSSFPRHPEETKAMCKMRDFICTKPPYLRDTLKLINKIKKDKIDKLHWTRLIETNYPCATIKEVHLFINNLINQNQDYRLRGVLKKARDIRRSNLISHNLLQTVETTIASYAQPPIKHNEQVLSIIACKYCYFMRNKMFHGQEADFTFCFTNHTEDDDITDFLNEILESLLFDLLCDFDNI